MSTETDFKALLLGLGEALLTALTHGCQQCVLASRRTPIGLETFISALYIQEPQVIRFVEDPSPLSKMAEVFCGGQHGNATRPVPPPHRQFMLIQVAPTLTQILTKASKLANAEGRPKATLEDFFAALRQDKEATGILSREWGLALR